MYCSASEENKENGMCLGVEKEDGGVGKVCVVLMGHTCIRQELQPFILN